MPIPTRSQLRAAFAEALSQQVNPTDPVAAIRAAVDVILPEHTGGLPSIRAEFLALADAIQGGPSKS